VVEALLCVRVCKYSAPDGVRLVSENFRLESFQNTQRTNVVDWGKIHFHFNGKIFLMKSYFYDYFVTSFSSLFIVKKKEVYCTVVAKLRNNLVLATFFHYYGNNYLSLEMRRQRR